MRAIIACYDRRAMVAVVWIPGLLDVDAGTLAACEPLSRIAARAKGERIDDAESALVQMLGGDVAVAPLAALGSGLAIGSDWVARADPVTTIVSHEDVRIVARVDDLSDQETQTLLALLDRHFADDGLAFAAPRRDAWFVRSSHPHALATVPLTAAIGRPLRTRLPGGGDARRWRRWWTEAQMLLHERPVALRERAPVNALWFSGAGTLPSRPLPSIAAYATHAREGDVLRGWCATSGGGAATLDASRAAWTMAARAEPLAIIADPAHDAATLARVVTTIVEPALAALDRGSLDRLVLLADGRADAARWTPVRAGWLARLRPRRAAFAVPADEDA